MPPIYFLGKDKKIYKLSTKTIFHLPCLHPYFKAKYLIKDMFECLEFRNGEYDTRDTEEFYKAYGEMNRLMGIVISSDNKILYNCIKYCDLFRLINGRDRIPQYKGYVMAIYEYLKSIEIIYRRIVKDLYYLYGDKMGTKIIIPIIR
jgi:hypothetical protein